MSSKWNQGLPFLPGNTFKDMTKSSFPLTQTLGFKNGFPLAHRPSGGVGQEPLLSVASIQQEIDELSMKIATITDDSRDKTVQKDFVPAYVAFDKQVLRFHAYFTEDIPHSSEYVHCVRPVIISYYLEDDTMYIYEPRVENSGFNQGVRLRRHRLPKNERGEHYVWKDLNLGMDLSVYGVKYRITDCNNFTKEFLTSEGIILNDPEPTPEDPYKKHRDQQSVFKA